MNMDESRIIIDCNEQGDGSYDINVVGYRNFKQHFSEAFYSIERPMSVLSVSDSSISGEVACNSATSTLLKHLMKIIGNGVKTKGHIFTEKELNPKFPFVDLIAIERFEEIWNSTIKKSDLDCYGWDANPYVWVISFERCEKPEE